MEKVIVLGGTGFIGRYLVDILSSVGQSVTIYDREKPQSLAADVEYVRGDIGDRKSLEQAMRGCGQVYHLAAHLPVAQGDVNSSDREMTATNVEGTRQVLAAMSHLGIRKLVYASSTAVYGIPRQNPITPDTPFTPAESYGASKVEAERLCQAFAAEGNDVIVVRPGPVIGERRLGVFQILFEWIYCGWNIPILGRGENVLQFIEVEDCASALFVVGQRPYVSDRYAAYNVGSADLVSLRSGLEELIKDIGGHSKIRALPKKPVVWSTLMAARLGLLPLAPFHALLYGESVYASIDAIKSDFGWTPRNGFVDMLKSGYHWYLENREEVLKAKEGSAHHLAPKHGLLSLVRFLP